MQKLDVQDAIGATASLQAALDAQDVTGNWYWDTARDRLTTDTLVAQLFGIEPELARTGFSSARLLAGVHVEDREDTARRMATLSQTGGSCVAEFRACSADGKVRWVLARGRYELDQDGRPWRGQGIVIDMTGSRLSEKAYGKRIDGRPDLALERIADHCLEVRKELEALDEPFLKRLVNMLLLEIGRRLHQAIKDKNRRSLM
ncbi:hypothetical protein OPKNFCMD_6560 [Methylobacterium crusticola]|uniref:histidine kinase n=1 Tax=Methylobacterium crusticola TaxID=1697972 RepID=A0ABQ4RAP6_9HYPH|nr:PAS domain-containing protein [Methylobacterium crusticola]GJD53782.1 hypothetical protein OPKNFCMD_6560 [Methylobacterium crusticola]